MSTLTFPLSNLYQSQSKSRSFSTSISPSMVSNFCLKASTNFLSSSFPFLRSSPIIQRRSISSSSIKMSAQQIIEHIVLFKVKPDTDPSKIDTMIGRLNGLISLDSVLHISATPLLRTRSSSLSFTHILHSRYSSKENLAVYTDHPSHVSVVTESVRPICEDIMAVDWVFDVSSQSIKPQPGSAIRATFLKLKEGNSGQKDEILGVIGGIKEKVPSIDQITYGENFSPARAKGYSIASIAVFPCVSELEGLDSDSELANAEKEKVRDLLESVLVVDFVVPHSQNASL
ncbi:stress-response A/B barrel domain-containing protein UP3-like [Impatiens glandulifera]|uniref:stress-response A/B barrel domain-containing protein UP3-like n=1 Tax=Impatiens glandulifera TaxID=253017 RepID=UPI001FB0E3A1|nr:stress-response A/B barrel domain-containing protein UP3-like [Impatiens glandulifera]